jgi:hypothetical protein
VRILPQMESPSPTAPAPEETPEPYEAPAVAWEEPYDPVGLTISCAKWEGNPACEQLYLH